MSEQPKNPRRVLAPSLVSEFKATDWSTYTEWEEFLAAVVVLAELVTTFREASPSPAEFDFECTFHTPKNDALRV